MHFFELYLKLLFWCTIFSSWNLRIIFAFSSFGNRFILLTVWKVLLAILFANLLHLYFSDQLNKRKSSIWVHVIREPKGFSNSYIMDPKIRGSRFRTRNQNNYNKINRLKCPNILFVGIGSWNWDLLGYLKTFIGVNQSLQSFIKVILIRERILYHLLIRHFFTVCWLLISLSFLNLYLINYPSF